MAGTDVSVRRWRTAGRASRCCLTVKPLNHCSETHVQKSDVKLVFSADMYLFCLRLGPIQAWLVPMCLSEGGGLQDVHLVAAKPRNNLFAVKHMYSAFSDVKLHTDMYLY